MQTTIASNLFLFLNLLLRRCKVLLFVLFVFVFNFFQAQTVISGWEKISFAEGTVIYIDSTGLHQKPDKVASQDIFSPDNAVAKAAQRKNNQSLSKDSEVNKKSSTQTKRNLPKKTEFTYHSKESDSSFSTTSKHQIFAVNPNSQWKTVIGIIEEAKYQPLHILWNKKNISEKEIFFAEHTISCKSSRGPPLY